MSQLNILWEKTPWSKNISNNAINAGIVCGAGIKKPKVNEITDLKLIYDKKSKMNGLIKYGL
ncbi:MAG: hypothetical protein CM15mP114_07900 [Alphaproteobacteria bacterium]|nr:MAG: hypothetical protein CM15mP114_07900 [Alphaproteobacteria bacterium]